jgi:hypothetical protein
LFLPIAFGTIGKNKASRVTGQTIMLFAQRLGGIAEN